MSMMYSNKVLIYHLKLSHFKKIQIPKKKNVQLSTNRVLSFVEHRALSLLSLIPFKSVSKRLTVYTYAARHSSNNAVINIER